MNKAAACFCLSSAVLACLPAAEDAEDAAEVGESGMGDSEDSGSGESSEDDASPPCDPAWCAPNCKHKYDSCQQELVSACTADNQCECVSPEPCPLCVDEACPTWEICTEEYGVCYVPCDGDIPAVFEPENSCEIPILEFPTNYLPFVFVSVDGVEATQVEGCAMQADGWTYLPDVEAILLCPQLCASAKMAATIEIRWGDFPCE